MAPAQGWHAQIEECILRLFPAVAFCWRSLSFGCWRSLTAKSSPRSLLTAKSGPRSWRARPRVLCAEAVLHMDVAGEVKQEKTFIVAPSYSLPCSHSDNSFVLTFMLVLVRLI